MKIGTRVAGSGPSDIRKMTSKQKMFVAEYLVDLNATQAAIRAGYSRKSAGTAGPKLLKRADVGEAVRQAIQERERRVAVTQDMVIEELSHIAFGSLRDAATWGPDGLELVDSAALTPEQAAGVAEVSETVTSAGGSKRIKRHDKVKALELLGKHLGVWTDKIEHSGGATAEVQVFRIPDNGRE